MKNLLLFFRELIKQPKQVGAAMPSSFFLAKKLAESVPKETSGKIVELGAGTGSVTHALTQRFSQDKLIIIERSRKLCELLESRFPNYDIKHADATALSSLIPTGTTVSCIVSSLPLRSLPSATVKAIFEEILKVLEPNGLFVQYTYSPRTHFSMVPPALSHISSRRVLLNIPPARIDCFRHALPA